MQGKGGDLLDIYGEEGEDELYGDEEGEDEDNEDPEQAGGDKEKNE